MLHQALTHIKKAQRAWQIAKPPLSIHSIILRVNKHIERVNKLTDQNIPAMVDSDLSSLGSPLKIILGEKKNELWKARNLESNLEQTERIKFFVNKRYDNFQNNTSKMLDSILQRKKGKVNL